MGIREWLRVRQRRIELTRRSVDLSNDERLIAENAPELSGMGFVKGAAFVLEQIDEFNKTATEAHSIELAGRLLASNRSWEADGLAMPYWGNLVVLRRLQADIKSGAFKPA